MTYMPTMTSSAYAIHTTSITPKIRFRPRDSRASTPPRSSPFNADSSRKMSMGWRSLQPQIRAAHELVALELGGGAGDADGTHVEEIGAIDEIEHLLHVLLDDQDREPL